MGGPFGPVHSGMFWVFRLVNAGLLIWFIVFTVLVLQKLDRIIEQLSERKPPPSAG